MTWIVAIVIALGLTTAANAAANKSQLIGITPTHRGPRNG